MIERTDAVLIFCGVCREVKERVVNRIAKEYFSMVVVIYELCKVVGIGLLKNVCEGSLWFYEYGRYL